MKKLFCLLLALVSCLLLTACVGEVCALPNKLDALFLARNPLVSFDLAQSQQMMNVMGANRVCVTEDALYTLELDEASAPVLGSYKLEGERLSDFKVLVEDCVPMWLSEYEGALYYVNGENGDRLERIDLKTLEKSTLTESACSYLQIKDGKLYYRNAQGFFCCAGLNGENETTIIDKACCYPAFLGDAILFQSENEGEILKLCLEKNGETKEIALTAEAAYAPVVIEDRLYYTSGGRIKSMRLNGMAPTEVETAAVSGAAEYIYEEGRWYARAVTEDYGIQQWRCALPDGGMESYGYTGYAYCDFMGGVWRVDADYFSDARLRTFILRSSRGRVIEYLYGEITNMG